MFYLRLVLCQVSVTVQDAGPDLRLFDRQIELSQFKFDLGVVDRRQ